MGHTDFLGLVTFVKYWEFNSSGFAFLKLLFGVTAGKLVAFFIFSAFLVTYYFIRVIPVEFKSGIPDVTSEARRLRLRLSAQGR